MNKDIAVPNEKIDVILDTDAFNEIDDQFAISYLICSKEKLNVKGFTAAPFFNQNSASPEDGMEKSYNEIIKLLNLAGRDDLVNKVYRGSRTYLPKDGTPVRSEAAEFMASVSEEYSPEHPLYIVAIGAITNVASALLMNPKMKENTVIVWLGGNSIHFNKWAEFNMMQDIPAARVVFDCGVPVVQLPCAGVVDRFITTGPELTYWLSGKNKLCDYLLKNTIETAEKDSKIKTWTRAIWDVTAVAWLLNDNNRFMLSEIIPSHILNDDNTYSFDNTRHPMRYVNFINRDALFEDLFDKLGKLGC